MMISRKTQAKLSLAVIAAAALAFATAAKADVIADWTFETSAPVTAGPFSPEVGAGSALGSHAGASVYSSPSGNGSTHSFSSNVWAVGDYYEFDVNTAGFTNVALTYDQTGSATGPGLFKVQYNAGSGWMDLTGGSYAIATTTGATGGTTAPGTVVSSISWSPTSTITNTALSFDLSSISGLTGIRIVDNGTSPIGTATAIGTAGTDRVDNVTFTGTAVPEPATAGIVAAGAAFMIGRRRRR
jgi:hypothetical protein